jgi:hypothetical protein
MGDLRQTRRLDLLIRIDDILTEQAQRWKPSQYRDRAAELHLAAR